jgi:hypothetical protein
MTESLVPHPFLYSPRGGERRCGFLDIGNWKLFGAWDLVIGI